MTRMTLLLGGWRTVLGVPNRATRIAHVRGFRMTAAACDILSKQSHWYKLQDGDACHFVAMKSNPSKKRAPTTNDATTLKLVPSVTTILAIVHSQNLQAWNLREVMFAAWKLLLDREGPRRQANLPKKTLDPVVQEGAQSGGQEDEIEAAVVEDTAGIKLGDIDVGKIVEEADVAKQSKSWDLSIFLARLTKLYLEKIAEAPNKGKAFHTIIEEYLIATINGEQPKPWPQQFRDYQMLFDEWMVWAACPLTIYIVAISYFIYYYYFFAGRECNGGDDGGKVIWMRVWLWRQMRRHLPAQGRHGRRLRLQDPAGFGRQVQNAPELGRAAGRLRCRAWVPGGEASQHVFCPWTDHCL